MNEKELGALVACMPAFVEDSFHFARRGVGSMAAVVNLDCVWSQGMRQNDRLPRTYMVVKVEKAEKAYRQDWEIVTVLDERGQSIGAVRLPYLTLFNMVIDHIKCAKEMAAHECLTNEKSLLIAINGFVKDEIRLNDKRILADFVNLGYVPMRMPTDAPQNDAPQNDAIVSSREIEESDYRVRSLADILYYSLICSPYKHATLRRCMCEVHGNPCGKILLAKRNDAKYCYAGKIEMGKGKVKTCREAMNGRAAYEREEDKKKTRAGQRTRGELRKRIRERLGRRDDPSSTALLAFDQEWESLQKKLQSELYRYDALYRFLQEQDENNRLR